MTVSITSKLAAAGTLEDPARGSESVAPELQAADLTTYLRVLTHAWSKTLATLGFSLIPIFFMLDVFMMPSELLPRFGVYRGAATLIVIAQYLFIRHSKPTRLSLLHGYFFTIVVGGMIALMTTDLGGFSSTYYAGMNLVLIAVNVLLPWEFLHSAINSLIIIALYVVLNIVVPQDDPTPWNIVVNNLYFLASTAVISTSINYVKQRLIKQEFFLRSDLKAARDALWGEMEVAKHIQTALLPKVHRAGGYAIAASMVPALEVGGDYYDIIETNAGESWACIGDVSGHGVESGLIMMMTQTSIFTTINDHKGLMPRQVLDGVNSVIKQNISRLAADRYMTITVMRLEKDALVHGGKHQDILVHRRDTGLVEAVETGGTWLGIVDKLGEHVSDDRVSINYGDTVLLYTDGVTEATNAAGEMYGERRLIQALSRHATRSPDEIVASLMREVQEYMRQQDDDLTLVVLRRVD